jgi:hypothetical protein
MIHAYSNTGTKNNTDQLFWNGFCDGIKEYQSVDKEAAVIKDVGRALISGGKYVAGKGSKLVSKASTPKYVGPTKVVKKPVIPGVPAKTKAVKAIGLGAPQSNIYKLRYATSTPEERRLYAKAMSRGKLKS